MGVSLLRGRAEAAELAAALTAQGYSVLDMSDNEVAKLHIRHLVGGQVPGLKNELLYRFEFPERPGALLAFLQGRRQPLEHQPVSLPQSRLGLRPRARRRAGAGSGPRAVRAASAKLGYPHWDETANPAYRLFLHAGDEADRVRGIDASVRQFRLRVPQRNCEHCRKTPVAPGSRAAASIVSSSGLRHKSRT